ncbi:MAG TPA: hypothetical protein VJ843_01535 [Candidatus Saccharimonadales bacterium]|nr:hypothetical protein [Candidatus Saccharimonadales bacterium]
MQDPQQPSTPPKKKDDTAEPDVTTSDTSAETKPTAYSDDVGKPATEPAAQEDPSSTNAAEATSTESLPTASPAPDPNEKLLPAEASEDKPEDAPSVLSDDTELPSLEAEEPTESAQPTEEDTPTVIPDTTPATPATDTPADTAKSAPKQTGNTQPVSISINSPKSEPIESPKPAAAPEKAAAQMAQNAFQPDNPSGVVGVAGGMVSTKPKKSRAKKVALILALLIILGGGAGAYYWWAKHKDTNKTATKTNSTATTASNTCSEAVKSSGTSYNQTGGTVSKTDQAYTATAADTSAVKVANSGNLTLTNPTITKSGDTSSSDNSSFTGQNAGVLATDNSKITISCGTVTTTGAGANGVFAYGSGSSVTLANLTLKASGQYAHGAMAAGGSALSLNNVVITTTGANSAPIATDRGGGTVSVRGGSATSAGVDSPGIYSTGTITVASATIKATSAEAAVVEGSNKIELTDSALYGNKKSGVMILQSTSGDATGSTGTFTMSGGKLSAADGPLFYVTNATGVISLKNVDLTTTSGILLKAAADQWGTSGKNGGTVTLSADSQTLNGNVVTDNISSAALILKNNSSLKGSVNKAALTLDASSSWNVTADSTITTLSGATVSGTSISNITGNGHTVYYSKALNASLNGQTYDLTGGGKLMPQ